MILKKPYGLLIKHFRLIHLILSLLMIYSTLKMKDIYNFFIEYISSGISIVNLQDISSYINITCYITNLLILLILGIIFWLMNIKKKQTLYYKFAFIDYVISFIGFIFFRNILVDSVTEIISPLNLRIYRDISLALFVFQAILLVVPILRGIGFDVKKFNFKKDIADLNLTDLDSEEVEVNFNIDKNKIKRRINRFGRNSSYIILRNKVLLLRIALIASIIALGYFCVNVFFINKIYSENKIVKLDKYSLRINKSYLTKYDSNGKLINDNYKYIVVNFTPINKIEDNKFDISKIDLKIGDKYYFPVMNSYSDFKDLGYGYTSQTLGTKNSLDYIMVFKLPNDQKTNRVLLRYMNGTKYSNNEASLIYKSFKLKLNDDTKKIMNINKNIKDEININSNIFRLDNMEINNNFTYSYKECNDNQECSDINKTISSVHTNYTLIKLTGEFKLNNKGIANSYKDYTEYYTSMIYITYDINGETKKIESKYNVTPSKVISENKELYMEVPNEISQANNINIHLKIRNIDYIIKIK